MQVSVEKVNQVLRRLTIVVSPNQLENAYTQHINRYAKNANIKGFRPGKAPMSFIQQKFGDDARKEALGEVIQKSLSKPFRMKIFLLLILRALNLRLFPLINL